MYRYLYGKTRRGIEEVFKAVDRIADSGGVVIARMPTGYGKTVSSFFLASAVRELGPGYGVARVIHVLPMRSLVENAARKAVDLSKVSNYMSHSDIGCQASIYVPDIGKDQLFLLRLVYTTLDSYILNFAKITPLESRWASYHVARASIYTSITIFDEIHLFTEVDEMKAFTSLIVAAKKLIEAKLPVMFATATIPNSLIVKIVKELGVDRSRCILVSVENVRGGSLLDVDCDTKVVDYEFGEPNLRTTLIEVDSEAEYRNHLVEIAKQAVRDGRKVLIVRNKVDRAIATYRNFAEVLGRERVVLIHGRLRNRDREDAMMKIVGESSESRYSYRPEADIIVSTQVIEAGVDIDVDVLVTDPAPLAQLVQRVGRVNRDGRRSGDVYIVKPGRGYLQELVGGVYDPDLVQRSLEELCSRASGGSVDILWRAPSSCDPRSHLYVLNEVYKDYYGKLSVDYEINQALEFIDTVVAVHRTDSKVVEKRFCGFVRESIEIPVVVDAYGVVEEFRRCIREENDVGRCIKEVVVASILPLSHRYLCLNWSKLSEFVGGSRGDSVKVLALCVCGSEEVCLEVVDKRSRACKMCLDAKSLSGEKKEKVFMDVCKDLYILTHAKIDKDEDCECNFLGIALAKGGYSVGLGLVTDIVKVL